MACGVDGLARVEEGEKRAEKVNGSCHGFLSLYFFSLKLREEAGKSRILWRI